MSNPDTTLIRSFFDSHAPNWDNNDEHDKTKIQQLLDKVGILEGDRILDLGCGTGVISEMLYERSKRQVTAVDLSEKMIEQAKSKHISEKEVLFQAKDFYSMRDGEFDLIIIFDAYPHFLELNEFKESIIRNLSEDGRFAIVHDLGRKQLHDCHKGRDVSLLSRDLSDPNTEAQLYKSDFDILKAEEGENYYLLVGQKKKLSPSLFSMTEERDKREVKTRQLLIQTFFSLLKEKSYSEITITDLIKNSKVSSSTFYSHFKSKEDIIKAIGDNVLEHVLAEKKKKEDGHDFSKESDPVSLLSHLFLHLEEDKDDLLSLLHDKEGKNLFYDKMKEGLLPVMESFVECGIIHKEGLQRQFFSLFLSEALTGYLFLWLEKNAGLDAFEASNMFLKLFQS